MTAPPRQRKSLLEPHVRCQPARAILPVWTVTRPAPSRGATWASGCASLWRVTSAVRHTGPSGPRWRSGPARRGTRGRGQRDRRTRGGRRDPGVDARRTGRPAGDRGPDLRHVAGPGPRGRRRVPLAPRGVLLGRAHLPCLHRRAVAVLRPLRAGQPGRLDGPREALHRAGPAGLAHRVPAGAGPDDRPRGDVDVRPVRRADQHGPRGMAVHHDLPVPDRRLAHGDPVAGRRVPGPRGDAGQPGTGAVRARPLRPDPGERAPLRGLHRYRRAHRHGGPPPRPVDRSAVLVRQRVRQHEPLAAPDLVDRTRRRVADRRCPARRAVRVGRRGTERHRPRGTWHRARLRRMAERARIPAGQRPPGLGLRAVLDRAARRGRRTGVAAAALPRRRSGDRGSGNHARHPGRLQRPRRRGVRRRPAARRRRRVRSTRVGPRSRTPAVDAHPVHHARRRCVAAVRRMGGYGHVGGPLAQPVRQTRHRYHGRTSGLLGRLSGAGAVEPRRHRDRARHRAVLRRLVPVPAPAVGGRGAPVLGRAHPLRRAPAGHAGRRARPGGRRPGDPRRRRRAGADKVADGGTPHEMVDHQHGAVAGNRPRVGGRHRDDRGGRVHRVDRRTLAAPGRPGAGQRGGGRRLFRADRPVLAEHPYQPAGERGRRGAADARAARPTARRRSATSPDGGYPGRRSRARC